MFATSLGIKIAMTPPTHCPHQHCTIGIKLAEHLCHFQKSFNANSLYPTISYGEMEKQQPPSSSLRRRDRPAQLCISFARLQPE